MSAAATVVVTGGNGRMGSRIVKRLVESGYSVKSIDWKAPKEAPPELPGVEHLIVDLNNYGEVKAAFEGGQAIIHMAAYPDPFCAESQVIFANNTVGTYHVLEAAAHWGFSKAVLASSESAYGFPWALQPRSPSYLPVDEQHPTINEDCYGLSKIVNEITGDSFHRRTGMQVVSMRLSSICDEDSYHYFDQHMDKPEALRRILWSYIDVRDAVEACFLALEAEGLGSIRLNIAADQSCSDIPTAELIRTYLPDITDLRDEFAEHTPLYSNKLAKSALGWQPVHTWMEWKSKQTTKSGL